MNWQGYVTCIAEQLDRFFISSNIGEHNIYTIDTYTYTNIYIQI